ncbi:uncharacterized protein LOC126907857 [Daktulosphaira vitifoliae]|uniref:uncharacterized protein LOC126907857 n=1 Tax=Daktulosphaira vitifoliae TaxID=58002 RepID=UPI0021AA1A05|nr:uncharacterized protein LOC126907857 [Daktulosphaira vitifoliae]
MCRFSLPYWAFVPALGVWPDGPTTSMISMLPAEIAKINVNGAQEPKFKYQKHPNTPSINGPSKLRKSASTQRPITKIYLKPSAKAKAGKGGVALSNPISTAIVKRGDTVSIEYLPVADAEVGDGGVAISRPELVIHFVD